MLRLSFHENLLLALSLGAGAIHVLAPDHWIPASIVSWQRGWRPGRTLAFGASVLLVHVGLGILLYFALYDFIAALTARNLALFTLTLVALVTLVRGVRTDRIYEVFRTGPRGQWAMFAVVSLLGPCESIIPIFIKAHQLGMGYLTPGFAFAAGTLVAGLLLIFGGKVIWNRPLRMARGLHIAHGRGVALPVTACVVVGLILALR